MALITSSRHHTHHPAEVPNSNCLLLGGLDRCTKKMEKTGQGAVKTRKSRNIISQCRCLPHIKSPTQGPPIILTSGLSTHCRPRLIMSALHASTGDCDDDKAQDEDEEGRPRSLQSPRLFPRPLRRPVCPHPDLPLLSPANGQIPRLHSKGKEEKQEKETMKSKKRGLHSVPSERTNKQPRFPPVPRFFLLFPADLMSCR
ncbi:hypothetical protein CCHR01_03216 [Colletotrichum chrysophilum]|uniref:Uncharacterized protein n=1 Tax=Colletotrichum chrysophilum TaxID=1836956 RepID=A0AAD9EMV3_9PEZI|nr:hypothetical protein CCHR01_03216 [Colletotrichum chrysophilum]